MPAVRLIVVALLAVAACGDGGHDAPGSVAGGDPGTLAFHDDFDADDARWRTVAGDGRATVREGALTVDAGTAGVVVAAPTTLGDDLFDVEVAIDGGRREGDGAVGVACRVSGDSWYGFSIGAGVVRITVWEDGEPRELRSTPVADDLDEERLAGRCAGGVEGGDVTLTAVVGGDELATAVDPTGLGSGAAGVLAVADSASFEARWQSFSVATVDGGTFRRSRPERFPALAASGISDGFDDRHSGFGSYVDEEFVADYRDGGYRLRANGFIQRSAPADPMPPRVAAEVTATKQSTGPGWYGLTWALDADHLYTASITDGEARIRVIDGRGAEAVVLASVATEAVRPTGEPNRIRTELDTTADGQVRITLEVNGTPVLDVTEPLRFDRIRFSQLVATSTRDSTEPIDVLFDDYRLEPR